MLAVLTMSGQDIKDAADKVYEVVEKVPTYKGGDVAMMGFIQSNIRYPDLEREKDVQGRVVVSFIVERDGALSDIHIYKSVTKGIDAEALRVVRLMPNFVPGENDGQKVRTRVLLPIKFKLAGNEEEMSTAVDTAVKKSGLKDMQMLYQKGIVYYDYENYRSARPWLQAAAELHYPPALYYLSNMYSYAKGCDQDYATAVKYLHEAADSGYGDAQLDLGYMYDVGHGYDIDKKEAVKWYQKAADQNNRIAICNLANCYINGKGGLPSDDTMARRLYVKSAEMGWPRAQYQLGLMYEKGEGGLPVDSSKALIWFQQAAGKNHALAMVRLADYSHGGLAGMRHSESIAVDYYLRAAKSGDASAQYQVAYRYEHGENGLPTDKEKAFYYYGESAKQNNASAQNNYAWMCYLQRRDTAQGLEYVRLAIKADTTDKNRRDTYAALLFLKGDYAEAERQQKKALDMGGKSAGYLERYGNILMKLNRKEEAVKYWQQALALPDHGKRLEEEIAQGKYIE